MLRCAWTPWFSSANNDRIPALSYRWLNAGLTVAN
jgi:hypothetical protein